MTSIRNLMILGALLGGFSRAEAIVPRCFEYLEGHTKPVLCVAISPDSKLVASGSSDGTVRLWEIATGKQLHALKANPRHVRNVAFSRDGKTIIACSCESLEFPAKFGRLDSRITWWDLKTHKQIRQLKFDEARLPMALSPNAKTIAVASRYWIYLYEADTGKALGRFDTIDETYALAFTPDSRRLAVAVRGDGAEIRDLATKKVVQHVRSDYTFDSMAFSPDGKRLAGSNGSSITEIHDLEGKAPVVTSNRYSDGTQCLVFLRGGKWLVIVRGGLEVISGTTGKWVTTANGYQVKTSSVALSPDGKILAIAGMQDNDISLWKPDEWNLEPTLPAPHLPRVWKEVKKAEARIALSPDGKLVAFMEPQGTRDICLYDRRTGKELRRIKQNARDLLAFTPDGKRLLRSWDREVLLHDVATGKVLSRFRLAKGDQPQINAVSDKVLVLGRSNAVAVVYDLATGKEIGAIPGKASSRIALSRDGKWLLTVAADNKLCVHDVGKKKLVQTLYEHTRRVVSIAISPDGAWCASRTRNDRTWVFDREKGSVRARTNNLLFPGPYDRLLFTADGKTLIATGELANHGLFVWDWQRCREMRGGYPVVERAFQSDDLLETMRREAGIVDAAVAADGALLTLGPFGLHFWDLSPPK